jgi:hypothetical protein
VDEARSTGIASAGACSESGAVVSGCALSRNERPAAWSATLEDTRILLLDPLVQVDDAIVEDVM